MRIEIEGRPPSAEALWAAASGLGHFTAMQVRRGRTRGLELHVARLEAANHELFGVGLDGNRVREFVRHALGDSMDASVRVYVFETPDDEPVLMVTVKEPAELRRHSASSRSSTSDRTRTSSTSRRGRATIRGLRGAADSTMRS